MDGRRPADPLSDDALDRELDAALNVEPSPEFVARVRTRVAGEAVGPAWWASWTLVASGGLAAAIVILVAVIWWPGAGNDRRAADTFLASGPAADSGTAFVTPPDVPEPRTTPAAPASPPSRPARRSGVRPEVDTVVPVVPGGQPPFAEVIVSADQQRALAAVMATLRRGVMPRLPDEPEVADEPLPAIQIDPITIADVAIVAFRQ